MTDSPRRYLAAFWILLVCALLSLPLLSLPVSAQLSPSVITIQSLIDLQTDGGTVSIPSGVYTESLTVNKSITLTGVTSATTIIQAVAGQRVITVTAGHDLRLNNLTLTQGNPTGADTAGGAVWLAGGSLQMNDCRIANNAATYGGGIFQAGAAGRVDISSSILENNNTPNHGGAIYTEGGAYLTDTQVLSNTAGWHGGGLHAQLGFTSLVGGLFSNNRANGDNGGAVNANNGLSIANTRFVSNTAQQYGGAVLQWNAGFPVTVSGAIFERNQAVLEGGGLWARGNVTVTNSLFLTNTVDSKSAADARGGGMLSNGGSLWISSSAFRGNQTRCGSCSFLEGGGVSIVSSPLATVQDSWFESNNGWFGGGLSSSSPRLTITGSTFRDNRGGYGGALDTLGGDIRASAFISNWVMNHGGAISTGGALTIASSTFLSNTAGAEGGAMWATGRLSIVNSAFVGNQSQSGGEVMQLDHDVSRTLNQVTISQPTLNSGPALQMTAGILSITNTIIASYTVGISQTGGGVTINGVLWHGAGTLCEGAGPCVINNNLVGAPLFTADGYHLTKDSPAIDHGVDSGIISDIDGNPRPWGAGYDIGAAEYPRYRAYLPLTLRQ
jgi:predicted outer membrane repeat protein